MTRLICRYKNIPKTIFRVLQLTYPLASYANNFLMFIRAAVHMHALNCNRV